MTTSNEYRIVRDRGGATDTEWDPWPKKRFADEREADQFCEFLCRERGEDRRELFAMQRSNVPKSEGGTGHFPILDRRAKEGEQ